MDNQLTDYHSPTLADDTRRDPLNDLLALWRLAKDRESTANQERVELERQLYTLLKLDVSQMSKATSREYKLSITYPKSRKWDQEALRRNPNLTNHPAFPFDIEFIEDRKRFNLLEQAAKTSTGSNHYYQQLLDVLTIKDGKPGFKVERISLGNPAYTADGSRPAEVDRTGWQNTEELLQKIEANKSRGGYNGN